VLRAKKRGGPSFRKKVPTLSLKKKENIHIARKNKHAKREFTNKKGRKKSDIRGSTGNGGGEKPTTAKETCHPGKLTTGGSITTGGKTFLRQHGRGKG